jgi:hypothetical protein
MDLQAARQASFILRGAPARLLAPRYGDGAGQGTRSVRSSCRDYRYHHGRLEITTVLLLTVDFRLVRRLSSRELI